MANSTSYIGAIVAVSAGVPATIDAAGFGALTYTTVGKIASFGAVGDESADIPIELLDGRTEHVNGVRNGGEIPFTFRADSDDAGQEILKINSNNNTEISFKITDPDGDLTYFYGKVANIRDTERTPSNYKGLTGVVRVNSARVDA